MLDRYYRQEYETRLAKIILFRSFYKPTPIFVPRFAGEWDMAALQAEAKKGLQVGRIFFQNECDYLNLDWLKFDNRRSDYQDPIFFKAMLGEFHTEFIALLFCEILLSQCIHFTLREDGQYRSMSWVMRFPNNRPIPHLRGYAGIHRLPSDIIQENAKCLTDESEFNTNGYLFKGASFSLKDFEALLGESGKVVLARVQELPAEKVQNPQFLPEQVINPKMYVSPKHWLSSKIIDFYFQEIGAVQKSLESLVENAPPPTDRIKELKKILSELSD